MLRGRVSDPGLDSRCLLVSDVRRVPRSMRRIALFIGLFSRVSGVAWVLCWAEDFGLPFLVGLAEEARRGRVDLVPAGLVAWLP